MAQFARVTALGWRQDDDASGQARVGGSGWYQFGTVVADTTAPTLTGSITEVSKTENSISISWPAGADNVAVTSYEVSSNGGSSYTDVGLVLAHTFTGLTASTAYALRVRAKDGATLVSDPPLAISITTLTPDTTDPVLAGSIAVTAVTSGTFTTTCPVGTDNVGVVGYDVSEDAGSTWINNGTSRVYNHTGKAPLTTYQIRWRCRDAAARTSNLLSQAVTTYRNGATGQFIIDNTGAVGGNPEGFLYNKVTLPDDADKWFSYVITTMPATGAFSTLNPDGTFVFVGPNSETMFVQLEVDGLDFGSPFLVTLYDVTSQVATPVNAISTGTATSSLASQGFTATPVSSISTGTATPSACSQVDASQTASPISSQSIGTATRSESRTLSQAPSTNRARIPASGQTSRYLARFYKQPSEFMDYDVDAADYLRAIGDTLERCEVEVDTGMTLQAALVIGSSVKFWGSGGTNKQRSKVTVRLITVGGRTKEVEIIVILKET